MPPDAGGALPPEVASAVERLDVLVKRFEQHPEAVMVDGEPVLVASVQAGEAHAYRNACPGTPLPLEGGRVEDGVLVCSWHGCRFDLRGGRRVDADGPGLGVLPIAVEGGKVRIGSVQKVAA